MSPPIPTTRRMLWFPHPRDVVEELPSSGTPSPNRLGARRTIGGAAIPPPRTSQKPAGANSTTAVCLRRRETLGDNRNGEPRFRARRCRLARQAVGAARVRLPPGGIDDKRPDPGMVDLRVDSGKAGPRAPGAEAHDPDLHAGALGLNSGPPLSPWQESMPSAPAETMSFGKYDRGP